MEALKAIFQLGIGNMGSVKLLESPESLLNFYQKELILDVANLWLNAQRVFLDEVINQAELFINFITKIVVVIKYHSFVDSINCMRFWKQKLQYFYFVFRKVLFIFKPAA